MPRDCTATRQLPTDEQSTIVVQPVTTMKKSKANKKKPTVPANARGAEIGRMGMAYEKATGNALERMVGSGQLTPDGADWVVQAIDPFHDYKRPLAGYPDVTPDASLVTCYKYTMNIAPGGGGGNWDCHIFSLPRSEGNNVVASGVVSALGNFLTEAAFTTPPEMGFLNAISVDAGAAAPLFPTSAAWNPAGLVSDILPGAGVTDIVAGYSRVIAAGFEVHNTTAEMYKNGRVTVYSMPQFPTQDVHRVYDATAGNLVDGTATFTKFRSPPSTSQDALKLAGSMQWDAKDGVYIPIPIAHVDNPVLASNNSPQLYSADAGVLAWGLTDKAIGAAASVPPSYRTNKSACINTVGAIFEGLTSQTTLTVVLKVYVERFPVIADNALMPLASPSAAYDVAALQLYSKLLQSMPIGTPVTNNASGDWFRWILKKAYTIAKPISGFIPGMDRYVNDRNYNTVDKVIGTVGKVAKFIP